MAKRGRPKGITASEDTLAVVCLLKELKWSDSAVGRIFRRNPETIRDWYNIGYHTIGSNLSVILVKDGRRVKMMRPSGNSTDIEYIFGKAHQGTCGGGKRKMPHIYGDKYEDKSEKDH